MLSPNLPRPMNNKFIITRNLPPAHLPKEVFMCAALMLLTVQTPTAKLGHFIYYLGGASHTSQWGDSWEYGS